MKKANSTQINLIKKYFEEDITPGLFEKLATGKFQIYKVNKPQGKGYSTFVYLMHQSYDPLLKIIGLRQIPVSHSGIALGFLKNKRSRKQHQLNFYLSYEGGEFIYKYIVENAPHLLKTIQKVTLDQEGEKSFLYGQNLFMYNIRSNTEHLQKRKIIFVLNSKGDYLGLGLFRIKQRGTEKRRDDGSKSRDYHSKSENFVLSIMNLTDAGQYLRKGHY